MLRGSILGSTTLLKFFRFLSYVICYTALLFRRSLYFLFSSANSSDSFDPFDAYDSLFSPKDLLFCPIVVGVMDAGVVS